MMMMMMMKRYAWLCQPQTTTFAQCAPETTKFGKITQNKGHFAVQSHSRSQILVPIESSYTTSYQDDS